MNDNSHFNAHFNTAVKLLQAYDGSVPLAAWLKRFFAGEKKYGSRDRKTITSLCHRYFRLGKALPNEPVPERLLAAMLLTEDRQQEWLLQKKPEWFDITGFPAEKKLEHLGIPYTDLFPYYTELSAQIDENAYSLSLLRQPWLFLRIRPGHGQNVLQKLHSAGIPFECFSEDCLLLENGTRVEDILDVNREAVVQDVSSQLTSRLIPNSTFNSKPLIWDCCAASGGKSLLAKDKLGKVELTVSDVRASILKNLKERFTKAGMQSAQSLVIDLTNPANIEKVLADKKFDLVICDAPCSGSGTWSRTPEQLYFFDERQLQNFSSLQHKISNNVAGYIKKDGYLLYITCSVFQKENESVVEQLLNKGGLRLVEQQYFKGYNYQADTLFAALFQCF